MGTGRFGLVNVRNLGTRVRARVLPPATREKCIKIHWDGNESQFIVGKGGAIH
jgi:hypothetical protein